MMKPRNLEEVKKEVDRLRDKLDLEIDEKIKDLVIGLRRWGIETTASCEGHSDGGLPYPWVDIDPTDLARIAKILPHWWFGKDKNLPASDQPRWIIKPFAGVIRILPEDKRSRSLEEMQEDAIAFGKWLQQLPEDYFNK